MRITPLGKSRRMRSLRSVHAPDAVKLSCGKLTPIRTPRPNFRQPSTRPCASKAGSGQPTKSLMSAIEKARAFLLAMSRDIGPSISSPSKEGRVSFVYVVRAENGAISVGVTANPATRLEQLERASHIPVAFSFIGMTTGDAYGIEAESRRMLGRQHGEREWLGESPESAISALMGAAAKLGEHLQIAGPEGTAVLRRSPASTSPGSATGGRKSYEKRRPPLTFLGWLQISLLTVIYSFIGFIAAFVLFAGILRDTLPGSAVLGIYAIIPFAALAIAYWGATRWRPSTKA